MCSYTEQVLTFLPSEFAQQSLQNFLYYLLSTMTDNISELCKSNPNSSVLPTHYWYDIARLSGILRGQESFSQAVSYGLNSKKWHGGRVPLIVNTILLGKWYIWNESKLATLTLSFQFFRSGLLGSLSGPTFPSSIPRRLPSCLRPKTRSRTKLVSLIRKHLLLQRQFLRNKLESMDRQLCKKIIYLRPGFEVAKSPLTIWTIFNSWINETIIVCE